MNFGERLAALEERLLRRPDTRAMYEGWTTAERVARLDELTELARSRDAAAAGPPAPEIDPATAALHARLADALGAADQGDAP